MRILTYLRQVLDAEESVHVANGAVALENSKLVMDTMDEYGVEEALRFRESGVEAEIVAVAIGPARVQDALRTALAMGVDRAIHVETDIRLDAIPLSKVLAQIATQEEATLIFSGGQQADWDSHALGAATAERLHWPQATWTSALELKGTTLTGKHDAGLHMNSSCYNIDRIHTVHVLREIQDDSGVAPLPSERSTASP